ncbi:MAG TPA: hypothetical protein VLG11_02235 [Candidatus Saccharimonadales bacterium]|nr:hypothetical protein [Candidatus Saccharimonadales bacterium]
MLQSTETLQSHAFVERSLEGAQELLARPELEAQLTLTGAYRYLIENSFIPNVSADGVVSIPREYQGRDTMPVLSAPVGTRLRLSPEFAFFTPGRERYARQALDVCFGDQNAVDVEMPQVVNTLYKSLARSEVVLPTSDKPDVAALVTTSRFTHNFSRAGRMILAAALPVMVLRPNADRAASPSVMVHETHHILQDWWHTVMPAEVIRVRSQFRQQRELEAYGVGAVVAEHMQQAGDHLSRADKRHLRMGGVLREAGGGQMPTRPTAEVMRHLCRNGIFIK